MWSEECVEPKLTAITPFRQKMGEKENGLKELHSVVVIPGDQPPLLVLRSFFSEHEKSLGVRLWGHNFNILGQV